MQWGVSLEYRVTGLSCELDVRQVSTRQVWVTEPLMLADKVRSINVHKPPVNSAWGWDQETCLGISTTPQSPSAVWMKIELSEKKIKRYVYPSITCLGHPKVFPRHRLTTDTFG